ncbi:MAG: SurA N-terminal domain-containing protein [Candidatus Schekmanbacteria bacterium]|nr:SurA N-terminal domain-containing protein [Candidatus Schekmanbacteria bacterium]
MLDLMRKHRRWISPVFFIIIVSFVAYYGLSSKDAAKGGMVAEVNGKIISYDAYRQQLAQTENYFRSQLKDKADEFLARMDLKKMVLNNIINKEVMDQAAVDMGIKASDSELVEKLKSYEVFRDSSGNIDKNQMIAILKRNRIDPKSFIEDQKKEIASEKLKRMVEDSAVVSDTELWEEYVKENEKAEAQYCYYPPDFYMASQTVPENELKKYFQDNVSKYKLPDGADIEYVLVTPKDINSKISVTEQQAREYYNSNQNDYSSEDEQIKASHILFIVKPGTKPDEEEMIKRRAQKVLDEAKKGKDFKALAQLHSEEPLATATGGDLGFFGKGEMDPEFEKSAFSLAEGEISGLVKSSFGYHIIKVEKKIKPGEAEPFEYVKDEVIDRMKREKGKDEVLAKASEIRKEWTGGKSEASLEIRPVRTKIYQDEDIEGIENAKKFYTTAYALKDGEISEPVRLGASCAVIKLIKKESAHDPKFEEVRVRVEKRYKSERGMASLDSHIKEIVSRINKGESVNDIASADKVTVETTGMVLRSNVSSDIKNRGAFTAAMFALNSTKRAGYVIDKNGAYVIVLNNKLPVSRSDFESRKSSMRASVIQNQTEMILNRIVENYKKKGSITVSKEFEQLL